VTGGDRGAGAGGAAPGGAGAGGAGQTPPQAPERRPWLERIGLAAIAMVMGALLAVMAVVAWAGGEWILAAMSGSGAFLTVGVGLVTLVRG
jgi:hypothetical protein